MYHGVMLTGLSLLIVGVWVIVQALAGGLAIRLRQAVTSDTASPARMSGGGVRDNPAPSVVPSGGGGGKALVR